MSDFPYRVGDAFEGGPIELQKYIYDILSVGGEFTYEGNLVTVTYVPPTVAVPAVVPPAPEPEEAVVPAPEPEEAVNPAPEPEEAVIPAPEPEEAVVPAPEPEEAVVPAPEPLEIDDDGNPATEELVAAVAPVRRGRKPKIISKN